MIQVESTFSYLFEFLIQRICLKPKEKMKQFCKNWSISGNGRDRFVTSTYKLLEYKNHALKIYIGMSMQCVRS